jgi:pimeloyl-ACP methyl ester carboxylesterase
MRLGLLRRAPRGDDDQVPFWSALSPRRRKLLAAVTTAGLIAAVLFTGHALLPLGDNSAAPPLDQPGPVLLIPGYGGSRDSLEVLAGKIQATGRSATVIALPGDGTGDLTAQSEVLQAAVDKALAGGAPSVDVIGYSAGGVVARLWVARHGAGKVRRVITLGSPLHGAQIAALGASLGNGVCPVACQQLVPGSALLSEANKRALPKSLGWLSLYTDNDETVTPPTSAKLDGATNVELQSICPAAIIGHGDLPTNSLVTGIVLRALAAGPLVAPVAADCPALSNGG